jgi:hypothetical protein
MPYLGLHTQLRVIARWATAKDTVTKSPNSLRAQAVVAHGQSRRVRLRHRQNRRIQPTEDCTSTGQSRHSSYNSLCGVIVYSYSPPACYGRRLVLHRMPIQELNKKAVSSTELASIQNTGRRFRFQANSWDPSFSGNSLCWVVAVMVKYLPSAWKAGMQKASR